MVAQALAQVQGQRTALEVEQVTNGLKDDQPAPGYRERTVEEERERLNESEARLAKEYAELMPDVEKLLEDSKGGSGK